MGTPQFVPPGSCLVLLAVDHSALWVTSAPLAEYVHHAWPDAWMCSAFRNEGRHRSSDLILEAIAATRWYYGTAPPNGMVTFVDQEKTKPKGHPGYCYRVIGFEHVGFTKVHNLVALQMVPARLCYIPPEPPIGGQLDLLAP